MKTAAGLQPRSHDLPKLDQVTDPATGECTSDPPEVVRLVEAHFQEELKRTTPETLSSPPWNDTQNPDCFDLKPHPETVTHVPETPAVTLPHPRALRPSTPENSTRQSPRTRWNTQRGTNAPPPRVTRPDIHPVSNYGRKSLYSDGLVQKRYLPHLQT